MSEQTRTYVRVCENEGQSELRYLIASCSKRGPSRATVALSGLLPRAFFHARTKTDRARAARERPRSLGRRGRYGLRPAVVSFARAPREHSFSSLDEFPILSTQESAESGCFFRLLGRSGCTSPRSVRERIEAYKAYEIRALRTFLEPVRPAEKNRLFVCRSGVHSLAPRSFRG